MTGEGGSRERLAAQAGWSESQVNKMVASYAHAEVGAPDVIDTAWGRLPEPPPDATQTRPNVALLRGSEPLRPMRAQRRAYSDSPTASRAAASS